MARSIMRKGELTSQQIVLIVLAVGAFVVVLLFLFSLSDTGTTQARDLCRLSILERATLPQIGQVLAPLQCTPRKICIALAKPWYSFSTASAIKDGSDTPCKQFGGEKEVEVITIPLARDNPTKQKEAREIIERETANALYDCWVMTGQGKLDAFKGEGSTDVGKGVFDTLKSSIGLNGLKQPKCIICTRVAIAQEVEDDKETKKEVLERLNVNEFLARNSPTPNSPTYLELFTGGAVAANSGIDGEINTKITAKDKDNKDLEIVVPDSNLPNDNSIDQLALIYMQILIEDIEPGDAAWNTGTNTAMIIGGVALATPVGKIASVAGPWFTAAAVLAASGGAAYYAYDNQKTNQATVAGACKTIQNGKKLTAGCSIVKPIKWDVKIVNDLCPGGIGGNL